MPARLPKGLIICLVLVAASSFAVSMYLEFFHLDLLERHPISVNLLSGVVGFSTASLTVAIGINLIQRHQVVRHNLSAIFRRRNALRTAIRAAVGPIVTEFPTSELLQPSLSIQPYLRAAADQLELPEGAREIDYEHWHAICLELRPALLDGLDHLLRLLNLQDDSRLQGQVENLREQFDSDERELRSGETAPSDTARYTAAWTLRSVALLLDDLDRRPELRLTTRLVRRRMSLRRQMLRLAAPTERTGLGRLRWELKFAKNYWYRQLYGKPERRIGQRTRKEPWWRRALLRVVGKRPLRPVPTHNPRRSPTAPRMPRNLDRNALRTTEHLPRRDDQLHEDS
jgi:hypothetical protein